MASPLSFPFTFNLDRTVQGLNVIGLRTGEYLHRINGGLRYVMATPPVCGVMDARPDEDLGAWRISAWLLPTVMRDNESALLALTVIAETEDPYAEGVVDGLVEEPTDTLVNLLSDREYGDVQAVRYGFTVFMKRQRLRLDTQPLRDRVPDLTFTRITSPRPFSATGTWTPEHRFHFDYAYRNARLKVGGAIATNEHLFESRIQLTDRQTDLGEHERIVETIVSKPDTEDITQPEFHSLFLILAERLTRAPFPYTFHILNRDGTFRPSGLNSGIQNSLDTRTVYAHSVEEARRALIRNEPHVRFNLQPVRQDNRVFPSEPPTVSR